MSRFDAPLDSFEMDDFNAPSFQAPPPRARSKRSSRPQTPSVPIVMPQPSTPARRSSTNGATRPSTPTRARPSTRSSTNSKWREESGNDAETSGENAAAFGALRNRGRAFDRAGRIARYSALQTQADGILPRYGLAGLRALAGAGAVALPFGMVYLGLVLLVKRERANLRAFWRGAIVAFLVFLTFKALQVPRGALEWDGESIRAHGGYLGSALGWVLRRVLGEIGAVVALVAFSLVALLLWTEDTLGTLLERGRKTLSGSMQTAKQKVGDKVKEKREAKGRDEDSDDSQDAWDEDNSGVDEEFYDDAFDEDPKRALPPRVLRDVRSAKSRTSPFLPVDDLLLPLELPAPPARFATAPEAEPFVDEAAVLDLDSPLEDPKFLAPRIEIVGAAPPTSVVDETPIDLKAVVANLNVDEELTPSEALEKQAEESAQGEIEIRAPKPELPRRRFGDGPLMPEYFDDAVRALDPPVPPDTSGAEEEIAKGVAGVQETLAALKSTRA
jgi:hypothetical protein